MSDLLCVSFVFCRRAADKALLESCKVSLFRLRAKSWACSVRLCTSVPLGVCEVWVTGLRKDSSHLSEALKRKKDSADSQHLLRESRSALPTTKPFSPHQHFFMSVGAYFTTLFDGK